MAPDQWIWMTLTMAREAMLLRGLVSLQQLRQRPAQHQQQPRHQSLQQHVVQQRRARGS